MFNKPHLECRSARRIQWRQAVPASQERGPQSSVQMKCENILVYQKDQVKFRNDCECSLEEVHTVPPLVRAMKVMYMQPTSPVIPVG